MKNYCHSCQVTNATTETVRYLHYSIKNNNNNTTTIHNIIIYIVWLVAINSVGKFSTTGCYYYYSIIMT